MARYQQQSQHHDQPEGAPVRNERTRAPSSLVRQAPLASIVALISFATGLGMFISGTLIGLGHLFGADSVFGAFTSPPTYPLAMAAFGGVFTAVAAWLMTSLARSILAALTSASTQKGHQADARNDRA